MMSRLVRWLTGPQYALGRFLVLMGLGIFCILGAVFLGWRNETWTERALLPLSDPLANLNELGVNVDLQQYEAADLARVLADIESAGFRWVRQRFPWSEIEPEHQRFEWATWDATVAACAAHDLELVAVLDGTPSWARADAGTDSPLTPPQEVADWGAFVAAFAGRYRGKIAAYQVWDEPNLAGHWGGRFVDPVFYSALLREGAVQIRQADPGVPVLLAALAPTIEEGPLNLNETAFLQRVLDAGGRPFFDAVALQPFGFDQAPGARPAAGRLSFDRVALLRRTMVQLGLADCPVWATAWGWNALPERWDGQPSLWAGVSEQQRTEYTLAALEWSRREWPWMGPMILYTWQPDVPADDPRWGFSLVDLDGYPRPLLEAIQAYNKDKPAVYTGSYVANSRNAKYTGAWRFSDAGADPPYGASWSERNAVIAFEFVGTALDLSVRRGDFWGFCYVSIDGRPASELPRDESGRSYLTLHDPLGESDAVTLARDLASDQVHRVEIIAHGGWGQWPIVGWTVHDGRQSPGSERMITLLLEAIGVAAATAATIQFVFAPYLVRPIYTFIGRVFRWYRGLPEWIPVLATMGVALAFTFSPWALASMLLYAALFVLFFLRIDLGLATVAFALPFYGRAKVLMGHPFSAIELGLALCVVAWLVARFLDWGRNGGVQVLQTKMIASLANWPQLLRSWRSRTVWDRIALDVGVVALLGVAWLAVGVSARRDVAVREFRVVFLESALFYALIRLSIRSARARQRIVDGWLLGAVVVSIIGIVQMAMRQELITTEGVSRVRGLYGSPNNLALYLERALPVLAAFAWLGRDTVRRAICGVAAVIVFGGLVLTFSRGALFLGVPASILALGLLQRKRKATWLAIGAVGMLALGFVVLTLVFSVRDRAWFDPNLGTGFIRLKLWRATWNMIADYPLTGVGLDNFLYLYRTRYVLPSAWSELDLSHPHNLLLDTWTRLGLTGVLVIGWLLGWFVHRTWGKLAVFGDNRTLVLGLTASMMAVLAHGLVDHSMFLVDLAFVFMLLLAMVQNERSPEVY